MVVKRIKSILKRHSFPSMLHCCVCEPRPSLSRRQKRRRYEDLYWCNVHVNAVLAGARRRRRQDKHMDYVFAEYEAILAKEVKDAAFFSDSP